jgi:hypothetical protein
MAISLCLLSLSMVFIYMQGICPVPESKSSTIPISIEHSKPEQGCQYYFPNIGMNNLTVKVGYQIYMST